MSSEFLYTEMLGKRTHRLGLAVNYGIDQAGVSAALERGLNYVFIPSRAEKMIPPVAAALERDRERYIVATGPTVGWFARSYRRACDKILQKMKISYIDVFHLFWLGVGAAWRPAILDELRRLKEEGKIRAIGCSIHDRPRAGRLAADGAVDLLMIRYNAAHPGAERDIFPHLPPRGDKKRAALVAYTATDWRKLLKKHRGFDGGPMTAADCYRFCLSHSDVDVTLCGPASSGQLEENLRGLERGPLSGDEAAWMRKFGAVVHG
jgi:aryl-alcohol dehydrogenase-like predicted oxidoreductase